MMSNAESLLMIHLIDIRKWQFFNVSEKQTVNVRVPLNIYSLWASVDGVLAKWREPRLFWREDDEELLEKLRQL